MGAVLETIPRANQPRRIIHVGAYPSGTHRPERAWTRAFECASGLRKRGRVGMAVHEGLDP